MAESLRTFIGVPVPCSAELRKVLETCGNFGRSVRPVAEDNLHVTLRFLGATPAGRVAEIVDVMNRALQPIEPFSSEIHGLGAFPHAGRPSVIWAGLSNPGPWEQLAERVEHPLRTLGFAGDRLRFHPHITVARVRDRPPAELKTWLGQQTQSEFGRLDVESVTLFESAPGPAGPIYKALAAAPLTGPD